MADDPDWLQAVDGRGRTYFYHRVTRQSTWNPPSQFATWAGREGSVEERSVSYPQQLDEDSGTFQPSQADGLSQYDFYDSEQENRIEDDWSVGFAEESFSVNRTSVKRMALRSSMPEAALPPSEVIEAAVAVPINCNASDRESSSTTKDCWVECKEVISGRTLFYHSGSKEIVFDECPVPPPLPDVSHETIVSPSADSGTSIVQPPTNATISRQGSLPRLTSASDVSSRSLVSSSNVAHPVQVVPDGIMQFSSVYEQVNELLGSKTLPWNFDNDFVQYFRAQMQSLNMAQYVASPEFLAFPRYFSTEPISPQAPIVCSVKMPSEGNHGISYTKIHCTATDSANDVIWKALRKCPDSPYEPDRCVLKVIGLEEYLYGDDSVLDFEYIRQCLRTKRPVQLSLLYIEDLHERINGVREEMKRDFELPLYPPNASVVELITDAHYQESIRNDVPVDDIRYLPIDSLNIPLRIQIVDVENVQCCSRYDNSIYAVCVEVQLLHGVYPLPHSMFRTRFRRPREGLRYFHEMVIQGVDICSLPRETMIAFSLFGVKLEAKEILLACAKQPLIEFNNCLVTGRKTLPLWELPADAKAETTLEDIARMTPRANYSVTNAPTVHARFDQYLCPVVAPDLAEPVEVTDAQVGAPVSLATLSSRIRKTLDSIVHSDCMTELDDEKMNLLWMARHNYTDNFSVLPKLLRCVNWSSPQKASEAYRMMYSWARPSHPLYALQLLDVAYPDRRVREYAVSILDELSDNDLQQILLQLVQVIKYEPHHDSAVSRFLLRRALSNPHQIGHFLFWHLKAEVHNPNFCERFALLIECYLVHLKRHMREVHSQNSMIQQLLVIAERVVHYKNVEKMADDICTKELRDELQHLNESFPNNWRIPLNPKWQVSGLRPQKCQYMSSKKLPLWLSFENSDPDGSPIVVMFKTGDDLRQDVLTLQLFRVMDRTWRNSGQDMQLRPYTCVATGINSEGEGVGMIEVVSNSDTISRIQIAEGGGALGALKNSTLVKWLQKYNVGMEYDEAVANFSDSCAGYCVATFCLGIGDRHNDNIMLTRRGHLFHIDFGHFLGNFKSKYGFKREKSPFVFTPEMAQVMGGIKSRAYKEFVSLCCHAFNLLRKEATVFLTLFRLMLSAGMPELQTNEDIFYLRDRLLLNLSDTDASKSFKKEIKASVRDFYRRVDNTIHNYLHK